MKSINYVSTHKVYGEYNSISAYSHLNVDGVSFDPQKLIDTVDKKNIYTDCPVWSHKANRTFLIRSPFDLKFSYVNDGDNCYIKLDPNNFIQDANLIYLESRGSDSWVGDGHPTIQLSFPTYLFWTKEKNIWIELSPYPYTSIVNNFTAIGGWWNLSNWTRPTSFGLQIVDINKPVVIKRGDPIYQICFYSSNLNDNFKLVKQEEIPVKIMKKVAQNINIKNFLQNISSKFLFAKQPESKCPFAFLFNK